MDQRHYPSQPRKPFQGSRETSANPSMTDLTQLRPPPVRSDLALRKDQRSGSGTGTSDGDKNNQFLLRNPFSSSADTSPTGSIADLELDHLSVGNGKLHPSLPSQTQCSSNVGNGFNPVNMSGDRGTILLQDDRSGHGQKHEFKSYLLTRT
jgi:hypothetical protein